MTNNFDPSIGTATRWRRGQPSPNPGGRPKSRLLSQALGIRLAEVKPGDPEGRTFAEVMAANLIDIACSKGSGAVTAANEIADRLEGRAPQTLAISDISAQLAERSDSDLEFFLKNSFWPEEECTEGPAREP